MIDGHKWLKFSGGGWWVAIMVLGKLVLCESCAVIKDGDV